MTTVFLKVEIQTEDYNNYAAEVEVHFHRDMDWGSDADGNRGVNRTFIDEVEIISVYIIEDNGKELELEEDQITEEMKTLIVAMAEEKFYE